MTWEKKQSNKYEVTSVEVDKPCSDTFSKFKDAHFRRKFFQWIWLPCAMFTLGIVVSQGGPTLLDLRIITDTSEETASFFFTSMYAGYLCGSFVAGGVHGKINNKIMMAIVTILSGAATIATPYCSNMILMLCMRAIAGFFFGCIDCSINAEHMKIWGVKGQALMQSVHFSFAIGGVIGPEFSAPFLAEKEKVNKTTNVTAVWPVNVTGSSVIDHTQADNTTLPHTTDIHYAYLIAGIIVSLASIPFILMLFCIKESKYDENTEPESPQRKLPVSMKVFLATFLCGFYIVYCCVETTFSSFLETFLVDTFDDITKEDAAHITTYFWAAFAAGRFTSIFTSKYLVAVRILYIQFSLLVIAITGFLVSAIYKKVNAVTAFTFIIGLACSAIYPSGFSWTEKEILKVTGVLAGVILVGSSFGSMICPFILGKLMQDVSSYWFCYLLAGFTVLVCSFFLFILFFNRFYVNKKYGKFEHLTEEEKQANLSSKYDDSTS